MILWGELSRRPDDTIGTVEQAAKRVTRQSRADGQMRHDAEMSRRPDDTLGRVEQAARRVTRQSRAGGKMIL